jgi:hypothetical protein
MAIIIPQNFKLKDSLEVTLRSYAPGDETTSQI